MSNQFISNLTRLSKDNLQAAYDEMAPTYNRQLWFDQHLLGVKRLRRQLMSQATGDVLEVACGTGLNFTCFGKITTLTAVDLSPEMLAIAAQEAEKTGLEATLLPMDAEALTFADPLRKGGRLPLESEPGCVSPESRSTYPFCKTYYLRCFPCHSSGSGPIICT